MLCNAKFPVAVTSVDQRRHITKAPPPGTPPNRLMTSVPAVTEESYLTGTSGDYVEDMFQQWCLEPKSVHPSWDSYFRTGAYKVIVK